MPLTYSPPPGILKYCNAGNHFESVIAFLSCFFATPRFIQFRVLTGYRGNANLNTTRSIFGPGELGIGEAAVAGKSFKLENTVNPDMDVIAISVTSWFREKFNLKEFLN